MQIGRPVVLAAVLGLGVLATSIQDVRADEFTLYSGRGESLVAPLIQAFERETGTTVNARFGGTAELAVLLQEEGDASPADLFWAQDAGALGATANLFAELPSELLDKVDVAYRDRNGRWIGTSGRGRVLYYSTERVTEDDLPDSVFDLTDKKYEGKVAWAPTNGSFQAFVTAMIVSQGEDVTREWLEDMVANDARSYRNNTATANAIADGEVDYALNNNYYLLRFLAADSDFPVAAAHFDDGDIGNLLLFAGTGIVATGDNQDAAASFIDFLLSPQAQQYITSEGYEYPVIPQVVENPRLASRDAVSGAAPDVDINELGDLEGTLALLQEVGLL